VFVTIDCAAEQSLTKFVLVWFYEISKCLRKWLYVRCCVPGWRFLGMLCRVVW